MVNKVNNDFSLDVGDEIYYGGDRVNKSGFGEVRNKEDFGKYERYDIEMKDGREMKVESYNFSKEYKGHGGTKFVTKEAYIEYKEEQAEKIKKGLDKEEG